MAKSERPAKKSAKKPKKRAWGTKHFLGAGALLGLAVGALIFHRREPPKEAPVDASVDAKPTGRPRFKASSSGGRAPDAAPSALDLKTQPLLDRATVALDTGDYAAALEASQDCLRIDPTNHACFDAQIFAYGRSGDYATARTALEECLKDEPDDVDCLTGMLVDHIRAGEIEQASTKADRIRWLVPDTLPSWMADAQVAEAKKDYEGAVLFYDRACTQAQAFACSRAEELRPKREAGAGAKPPR